MLDGCGRRHDNIALVPSPWLWNIVLDSLDICQCWDSLSSEARQLRCSGHPHHKMGHDHKREGSDRKFCCSLCMFMHRRSTTQLPFSMQNHLEVPKDCLLKLRKHWTSCERKRKLFRKPWLVSNCSWWRNRQIALTDSVYTFTSPSEQTLPSCLIWLKHCVPEPLQILTSKQASRSLSKELNSTALAFKSMRHKLDWCWKVVVQNTNMNASMHCNLFCLYSGSIWSDPQQQATH